MLSAAEFDMLSDIKNVLRPMESATSEISGNIMLQEVWQFQLHT